MPQTQKNQKRSVQALPFVLSDNHPLVKLWNGMKAMGFFRQFKDYAEYKSDPGRKPDNEKKEPGEVEQRIFNGK